MMVRSCCWEWERIKISPFRSIDVILHIVAPYRSLPCAHFCTDILLRNYLYSKTHTHICEEEIRFSNKNLYMKNVNGSTGTDIDVVLSRSLWINISLFIYVALNGETLCTSFHAIFDGNNADCNMGDSIQQQPFKEHRLSQKQKTTKTTTAWPNKLRRPIKYSLLCINEEIKKRIYDNRSADMVSSSSSFLSSSLRIVSLRLLDSTIQRQHEIQNQYQRTEIQ